ncbi:trehalose-phosphatase [Chloroflexota bacterium]
MQHLFQSWELFATDVKRAEHVLLLSDYDGTLTPIMSRPDEAILSPGLRGKLGVLAEQPTFTVGIISGRSLSEIRSMVGISGIYYAGNHGLEIEGPGVKFVSPAASSAQGTIKVLVGQLSAALADISGVIIEDKGLSLSVHYRLMAADDESQVAGVFRRLTSSLISARKIRVTSGKKVWEVRPPIDWHKGKAADAIREETKTLLKLERLLTIYLGDDTTDEDAFKVVRHPYGRSIFVGGDHSTSSAGYFLDSTSEVEDFLSRLLDMG